MILDIAAAVADSAVNEQNGSILCMQTTYFTNESFFAETQNSMFSATFFFSLSRLAAVGKGVFFAFAFDFLDFFSQ